jgi:endo-1,4-beta-xylanase
MTIGGEEWRQMDAGTLPTDDPSSRRILADARRNIERYRQRDVTLRLTDHAGQPLPNVPVKITQTRSDFPFGDQLWELDRLFRFNQHETDRGRYYRQRFAELFNAANALCYWTERSRNDGPKMEDVQGVPQLSGFEYCARWAAGEGLIVKGHPLFWSIPKCIPEWVLRYDHATRMKFAEVRVRSLVASQRGRIRLWDAVNEPLWEAAFANIDQRHWPALEPAAAIADYVQPVLAWCRQEDPAATFLINDYGLEQDPPGGAPRARDGTPVTATLQRKRMIGLVAELRQRHCPPDGIGMQAHTGGPMSPAQQWEVYDELAETKLPLHVTEFWPSGEEPADPSARAEYHARVADYVADYLTAAFGHPAIDSFFGWGLLDHAVRWMEHSAHELRPLYHRLRQLLRETWMSRCELVSDAAGVIRFRGFFGRYTLETAHASSCFDVGRGLEGTQSLAVTT